MTIEAWVLPAIISLLLWGSAGFIGKISLRYLSALEIVVYHALAFLIVVLASRFFYGMPTFSASGVALAIITGAAGTMGQLFMLLALKEGSLSKVVVITSLYPGVALLLAFLFLQEIATLRQIAGIGLGILSIALLTEKEKDAVKT